MSRIQVRDGFLVLMAALWCADKSGVLPIFLLALLSTVVTFGIAGRVTQNLRKKEEKKDAAS